MKNEGVGDNRFPLGSKVQHFLSYKKKKRERERAFSEFSHIADSRLFGKEHLSENAQPCEVVLSRAPYFMLS